MLFVIDQPWGADWGIQHQSSPARMDATKVYVEDQSNARLSLPACSPASTPPHLPLHSILAAHRERGRGTGPNSLARPAKEHT
eukprot:116819-Amphidinium_carterae.1